MLPLLHYYRKYGTRFLRSGFCPNSDSGTSLNILNSRFKCSSKAKTAATLPHLLWLWWLSRGLGDCGFLYGCEAWGLRLVVLGLWGYVVAAYNSHTSCTTTTDAPLLLLPRSRSGSPVAVVGRGPYRDEGTLGEVVLKPLHHQLVRPADELQAVHLFVRLCDYWWGLLVSGRG